jgi:hypothetical protein
MAAPDQDDVREQIRELRQEVDALRREVGARPKVTLRALQDRIYLGQTAKVAALATDARGRVLPGAPVTLTTSWGRLRSSDGSQASSVAARTGEDGSVLVTLVPPTAEDLSPVQQDSLEAALRVLDPGVRAPEETVAGLREIARRYRWDGNPELRRAVDVAFRDFGGRFQENPRLFGEAWSYVEVTVLAFARDGSEEDADTFDTSVLAVAALPLRITNWLGPWLRALLDVAEGESTLNAELRSVRQAGQDADELLTRVYTQVREYVGDQKGTVGELVGRRVAESSLRDFLDNGIRDLPVATQVTLLPALEVASGAVATAGAHILGVVGQTRKDLGRTIDRKVEAVPRVDLSGVTGRLDQLAGEIAIKADAQVLERFRRDVDTRLSAKADRTLLDGLRGELQESIVTKADRTAVDALTTSVNNVNRDLTTVRNDVRQVSEQVGRQGLDLTVLGADLNGKLATKADAAAITQLAAAVDTKVDRTIVDALSANVTSTNRDVGALKEASSRLNDRVTNLNTSVSRLDTTLKDIQRRVGPIIGPIGPVRPG